MLMKNLLIKIAFYRLTTVYALSKDAGQTYPGENSGGLLSDSVWGGSKTY